MESDDNWEDSLFCPPEWPYEDGDPAAPAAHPTTIHQYGYDIRQLDMLPVQAGYTQRRRRVDGDGDGGGGGGGMTREEAQQYYSQFLVFQRIMLDPEWAKRQQQQQQQQQQHTVAATEKIEERRGSYSRRLSLHRSQSRGRHHLHHHCPISKERRGRRLSYISATDSAQTRVSHSPSSISSMSDNNSDSDSESRRAPPPAMRAETSVTGISLGKTFAVLRIPLVIAILAAIIFELAIYFVVRQLVRAYEACVIWWGGGIGAGRLFRGLRSARSYDEYMEFARAIDSKLGVDTTSGGGDGGGGGTRYFDGHMVVRITRALRRARVRVEEQMVDEEDSDETDADDDEVAAVSQSDSNRRRRRRRQAVLRLCEVLRQGAVRGNAGGWENSEVWSRAYAQRNPTVDAYVAEVERSLACVRQTPVLRARERLSVFADLGHQLGRTALCLSGGAAMCWKHLGVARCLLDEARLPRVISGTSAGSLVAAMLATYTDTELRRIVRPELAKYLTACQTPLSVGLRRWLRRSHYFDAVEWAGRVQVFTRGNMTFREAFERTGKVLNISCTPVGQSSRHCSAPRLLNYVTAPDVLVWSAVLASAGLPGVLPPMVLLMKTRGGGGRVRAYTDLGVLWRDGSFRSDIPYGPDLRHLNVQFTVVSQVNPHIAMFFYDRGGSIGQPPLSVRARRRAPPGMWRGGFVLSALEHVLKLDIRKWLRLLCDLNLVPLLFNQDWSYVWLQKFDGNVTVLPRGSVGEWAGLLRDPSETSLLRSMQAGAEATWPKIQMLAARQRIEDAVASGWAEGYQQMKRKKANN